MDNRILVTGGAGYIGSHTCVELLNAGYDIAVYDNFINSDPEACARVMQLCDKAFPVIEGDVRDTAHLTATLKAHNCKTVVHFAGLKAVGESSEDPVKYYDNNVAGSLSLLKAMQAAEATNIVFSSSATVYGEPEFLPYTEDHPLRATNPYGQTKLMIENILRDTHSANPQFRIAILRYFNPCGAHQSGRIGEAPKGVPNNLMPYIAQVATGQRDALNIWGNDYPTPDGTGIRDYIHVVDLAKGHVSAIAYILEHEGCLEVNLGSGRGASVLEVLKAFSKAVGRDLPSRIKARRPGDVAAYYANADKARALLNWQASRSLDEICADHWRWQSNNPNGYEGT